MKAATLRRTYLREAAIALILARSAVRVVPFSWIISWANKPPRHVNRFAANEIPKVAWAIESVATRPWMTALCLPQALAAHAMLRRRGLASRLCLGVARENGLLTAHAWVEVGHNKIVGGAESARYTHLAAFGGAS
jgi:transglutaminase-like putative cysteine protease